MTTGIKTLISAMPAVATSVPPMTTCGPSITRSNSPVVSTSSAPAIAESMPKRRANHGAVRPAAAKHNPGKVVSTPAHSAEAPRSPRISASNGPTLVIAGRRFNAVRTTATTSSAPPAAVVEGRAFTDRSSADPSSSDARSSSALVWRLPITWTTLPYIR